MKFDKKIAQKLYQLAKPKPNHGGSYANFVKEHAQKTNATLTEAMTSAKAPWSALSDAQKAAYINKSVAPPAEYPRKLIFTSDKNLEMNARRMYLDSLEDFVASLEAMKVGAAKTLKTHVIRRVKDQDDRLMFSMAARKEPASK